MHQLSAVGCGKSIDFLGEQKIIKMGFAVVDPTAILKVKKGVYTGFSQGGSYVRKWKGTWTDGKEYTYYIANPGEVSLVDSPCLPTAHFDYVKADGTSELRKFAAATEPTKFSQADAELIAAALRKSLQEPTVATETEKALAKANDLLKSALDRITALETAAAVVKAATQGATSMTQEQLDKAAADLLEKAHGAKTHLKALHSHIGAMHKAHMADCQTAAAHIQKCAKAMGVEDDGISGSYPVDGVVSSGDAGGTRSEDTAKGFNAKEFSDALLKSVQTLIDDSQKTLITALLSGGDVAKGTGVGDRELVAPGTRLPKVTTMPVTKDQDSSAAAVTEDDKPMTADEIKKALQGDQVQRLRMAKMIRPATEAEAERIQASMSMAAVRR
jgi:hypothetical protein